MSRPRKQRPPRDEHAPTSFTPDIDIWSLAIRDLAADETARQKETFLKLYRSGASPKEAAYNDGHGVSYKQIIIWQFEDTVFASEMQAIADERRAHPALARAIFLDHLANTHNAYGAAEAGGFTLAEFKAMAKEDRAFKKAWKHALAYAVGSVEQAMFLAAVRNERATLDRTVFLNAHMRETYKPELSQDKLGPSEIVINVNVAIDPARQPKRLPPATGTEISLPSEVDHGQDD